MRYLLVVLAVWRVAHAFALETGPLAAFVNAREWIIKRWGFDSWQAEFARCPLCQSLWIGLALDLLFFPLTPLGDFVLLWLATSGGVTLLHLLVYK